MQKDGYALAKQLQEENLRSMQAMMNASDPVFTVMGMPYCWKCSHEFISGQPTRLKGRHPIKVQMMREQVVNGIHYLIIECHGESDKMKVSNQELLSAQASGGNLEIGWAFKPPEIKKIGN